jgi:hypothetical protein
MSREKRLVVQLVAREFGCHMRPEVVMPGKIEIVLSEERHNEPYSRFLDELETYASRQGAEARRDGTHGFSGAIWSNDILTIGLVGAAATAVFARNVIGIAKDWIELTTDTQRKVKVTIGDKVVEIKQGDDIRDLLQKYFPDDGTSNPL